MKILEVNCLGAVVWTASKSPKNMYLWIIPKLVVTLFSVILMLVMILVLIYLIFDHSQFIIDLVAEHVTSSDYEQARFTVKIGGTTMILLCLFLAFVQSWFYSLLYRCFKFFKRRYVWLNVQAKMAVEQNANNFGDGKFDRDSFLRAWCDGRRLRKRDGEILADHAHLSVPEVFQTFDGTQSCSDV
uniref:Uncharacterized protein n=1 Tax=Romanomermis culicivorax TaxID=13658 RepID=A0A915KJV4_ROMCU